ncbi:unnamed protein product, partial [Ixodes pacificus]
LTFLFTHPTATFSDLSVDKLHKRTALKIGSSPLPACMRADAGGQRACVTKSIQLLHWDHMVRGPSLQCELRGGNERVDAPRASPSFYPLSSSPRDNAAHVHLRPIGPAGNRH